MPNNLSSPCHQSGETLRAELSQMMIRVQVCPAFPLQRVHGAEERMARPGQAPTSHSELFDALYQLRHVGHERTGPIAVAPDIHLRPGLHAGRPSHRRMECDVLNERAPEKALRG